MDRTHAASGHLPVMYAQVLEGLRVVGDGTYLDGTFGRGGHARGVLAQLGPKGKLLVMDKDPEAIAVAEREFGSDARVAIFRGSFAELAQWLAAAGERDIADVLWTYGEEKASRRIARAIVARRVEAPLMRTAQLAELIASAVPRGDSKIHPATRSFQAIRIFINRELADLEAGLDAAHACLKPGGRLAVIAFHSLEDRIVKQFIARHAKAPPTNRRMPVVPDFIPTLLAIGDATKATADELAANPRARSAVLRVAEKLGVPT